MTKASTACTRNNSSPLYSDSIFGQNGGTKMRNTGIDCQLMRRDCVQSSSLSLEPWDRQCCGIENSAMGVCTAGCCIICCLLPQVYFQAVSKLLII